MRIGGGHDGNGTDCSILLDGRSGRRRCFTGQLLCSKDHDDEYDRAPLQSQAYRCRGFCGREKQRRDGNGRVKEQGKQQAASGVVIDPSEQDGIGHYAEPCPGYRPFGERIAFAQPQGQMPHGPGNAQQDAGVEGLAMGLQSRQGISPPAEFFTHGTADKGLLKEDERQEQ